jgi:hypothetical protein
MEVTILCKKTITLPPHFEEHSERILQYGIDVYNNIEKLALLQSQKEKFESLEKEYNIKIENYELKIKECEATLKKEKSFETEQINSFIEKGRIQRESEINYLKNELKEKDDKLRELIQKRNDKDLEELNSRVASILGELQSFNTYVGVSTAQKGSVGENIVFNYLSQNFSQYNVIDTSKNNASMSDLFMSSYDGKYNILVEVKNVNALSSNDKSKFINDIEISGKNGKINGAILFSMNNTNINSRPFNILYHYGIPTLYISNIKNNMEMIKYGIFVMEELVLRNKFYNENSEKSELNDDFIKMIDSMNKYLNYEVEMLEKDRKMIISFENQYKERFKKSSEQMGMIKNMVEKYNVDISFVQEKDKSLDNEQFINNLLQKIINNGLKENINQATLTKIGIKSCDILKAGGVKEIKSLLKSFSSKENSNIVIDI